MNRLGWKWLAVGAVIALVAVGYVVLSGGGDGESGGLSVSGAWVRATVGGEAGEAMEGAVTGAFMVITNDSDRAERLVRVSAEEGLAAAVEIHETTRDENDVMRMQPVAGIDVPAKGQVALKPGGYHIMLLDVQRPLNPGDTVTLTLTFESGQTLEVQADVRAME